MKVTLTLLLISFFFEDLATAQRRCPAARDFVEEGRKCRKECKKDSDCSGALKRCRCDDKCGKSCFNPNALCEPLPGIDNGEVRYRSGRKYGRRATYVCNEGYQLKGDSSRKCRSDKRWSGTAPSCIQGCPPPPRQNNAYPTYEESTFRPGETVIYTCNTGYVGNGNSEVACKNDRTWTSLGLYCGAISCPIPEDPEHGRVIGDSYSFASTIDYQCDTGYQMIPSERTSRICGADRQWTRSTPVCEIKRCNAPVDPVNGRVDDSGVDYTYGSRVRFVCDDGFKNIGSGSAVCNADAVWEGTANCVVNLECNFENFRRQTCSYKSKPVGAWRRLYTPSDRRNRRGYVARTTVFNDEIWLTSPPTPQSESDKCFNFFYKIDRDGSLVVKVGEVTRWRDRRVYNRWKPGEVTVLKRDFGNPVSFVATAGTVNLDDITVADNQCSNECEPNPCENGGTCQDEVDSFTCTCTPDFQGGTCSEDLKCPEFPQDLPDGNVQISYQNQNQQYHLPGTRVTYTCNERFKVSGTARGSTTIVCLPTRKWNSSPWRIGCVARKCPPLERVRNGELQSGFQSGVEYPMGTAVSFTCFNGYRMQGINRIDCLSTERWSSQQPQCSEIRCNRFNVKDGSLSSQKQDHAISATVTITCNDGFKIQGQTTVRCTEQGTWSPKPPRCVPIPCNKLGPPDHGFVREQTPTKVTFGCDNGMQMVGPEVVRCMLGEWSPNPPTCEDLVHAGQAISTSSPSQLSSTSPKQSPSSSTEQLSSASPKPTPSMQQPAATFPTPRPSTQQPSTTSLKPTPPMQQPLSTFPKPTPSLAQTTSQHSTSLEPGPPSHGAGVQPAWNSWGEWSSWEPCSSTCGSGQQMRKRECLNSPYNTVMCRGSNIERKPCRNVACSPLPEPSSTLLHDGMEYLFFDQRKTWSEAKRHCEVYGATMVIIKVQDLHSAIIEHMDSRPEPIWLGMTLKHLNNQPKWTWLDNAPFNKENWQRVINVGNIQGSPCYRMSKNCWIRRKWWEFKKQVWCWIRSSCNNNRIKVFCQRDCHCWNGGSCSEAGNCVCLPGFTGAYCQETVSFCASLPCLNGATCHDRDKRCECQPGFYGTFCDQVYLCPHLQNPPNGRLIGQTGSEFGSQVGVSCNEGFRPSSDHVVTCMDEGVWSGDLPTCLSTRCEHLPDPENGILLLDEGNAGIIHVGTQVTVRCNEGYQPDVADIWCTENGWTNTSPSCNEHQCGVLNSPAHGRLDFKPGSEERRVGARVDLDCDNGYKPSTRNIICNANGWSDPTPTCYLRPCFLDETDLSTGVEVVGYERSELGTTRFPGGEPITLECSNPQEDLIGVRNYDCGPGGLWNVYPRNASCHPRCPPLQTPTNGRLRFMDYDENSGERWKYGSRVRIVCAEGYKTNTTYSEIACYDGWFPEIPSCEGRPCVLYRSDMSSDITVAGMKLKQSDEKFINVFNSITLQCKNRSLQLAEGLDPTITCLPGMLWTADYTSYHCVERPPASTIRPRPTTASSTGYPLDDLGNCPPPQSPHLRFNRIPHATRRMFQFSCDEGFELVGRPKFACYDNGEWGKKGRRLPMCKSNPCKAHMENLPEGVEVVGYNRTGLRIATFQPGQQVRFKCSNVDAVLVGSRNATCLERGVWRGALNSTSCHDPCPPLPQPLNGRLVSSVGNVTFRFRSRLTVGCNEGYGRSSSNEIVCEGDPPTWNGDLPTCQQVPCSFNPDDLPRGVGVHDDTAENDQRRSRNFPPGHQIHLKCLDEDAVLVGDPNLICVLGGVWNSAFNTTWCRKSCSRPPIPANGRLVSVEGSLELSVGSRLRVKCDEGYELSSEVEAVCEGDPPEWNAELPTCTEEKELEPWELTTPV